MSDKEILKRAIHKAIEGGWNHAEEFEDFEVMETMLPDGAVTDIDPSVFEIKHKVIEFRDGDYVNVEAIIFDHDFAKALWPIIMGVAYDTRIPESKPLWQYHLQQMVIADNPIQYLREHLDD